MTMDTLFVPQTDESKFDELLIYICERQITNRLFGLTKLNALLCMSDLLYFRRWRESITGAQYVCGESGPWALGIDARMEELDESGRVTLLDQTIGGFTQHRPMALDNADLFAFNGAEIAIVEQILRATDGQTPLQLAELTDELFGWRDLSLGDALPYEAALTE